MADMHQTQPRIIAMANQKGGVGKTTTAINLATALAATRQNVTIVDLDPQGNASTGLGIAPEDRAVSAYDLMAGDATLEQALLPSAVPGLSVVASTLDLLGIEQAVASSKDRAHRLRHVLRAAATDGGYSQDYILIDCPPSLNLLTINALAAADAVMVPLQCEFFALEGLTQLLRTVEHVRSTLNPDLAIHGIVLTMYDRRNSLSHQVMDDVRHHLGDKVYQTVIPRNVRVSEAPSFGKPALLYDINCAGSQAYIELASEMLRRERAMPRRAA
jgi:chromosome partitioning protein